MLRFAVGFTVGALAIIATAALWAYWAFRDYATGVK